MPPSSKKVAAKRRAPPSEGGGKPLAIAKVSQDALVWLKAKSTKATLESMARYGLPKDRALGVSVSNIQKLARELVRDHGERRHELAQTLWDSACYEARMLAAYVDDPRQVTLAQMERWCRDFDNWGICDTVCFVLFDRSDWAWQKAEKWAKKRDEFGKRAAFALLWALTVHDKKASDTSFLRGLAWIEHAAADNRHFVKKAVNMALRAIGKRNAWLHGKAMEVATRLAGHAEATARWIGKNAMKELTGPVTTRRLAAKK